MLYSKLQQTSYLALVMHGVWYKLLNHKYTTGARWDFFILNINMTMMFQYTCILYVYIHVCCLAPVSYFNALYSAVSLHVHQTKKNSLPADPHSSIQPYYPEVFISILGKNSVKVRSLSCIKPTCIPFFNNFSGNTFFTLGLVSL